VLPGISIFDALLVSLSTLGTDGIEYEASDLVSRERPIQNDIPCIIWQSESGIFLLNQNLAYLYRQLQGHLIKFYSPDYPVTPLLPYEFIHVPIKELTQRLYQMSSGAIIYIPTALVRTIVEVQDSHLKARYDFLNNSQTDRPDRTSCNDFSFNAFCIFDNGKP